MKSRGSSFLLPVSNGKHIFGTVKVGEKGRIVIPKKAREIFDISLGLLAGSLLNDKQVGGVYGALLTNVSAWFSGTWFDVSLVGGWFETIAYALPFAHAVDATRAAIAGEYTLITPHLWWVLGYAVVMTVLAVAVFRKKMNSDRI